MWRLSAPRNSMICSVRMAPAKKRKQNCLKDSAAMAESCFDVKLCRRIGVSSRQTPGACNAGPFAQAGFVDEDDAAAFSLGFF